MLTYELWRSDHHSGLGVNREILGGTKVDDLQLLRTFVLQNDVLRLKTGARGTLINKTVVYSYR